MPWQFNQKNIYGFQKSATLTLNVISRFLRKKNHNLFLEDTSPSYGAMVDPSSISYMHWITREPPDVLRGYT